MFDLIEDNLGKRQRELNAKVQDAFNKRTDFDEIKLLEEKSDVHRLFKIDLAILYKNVDYIIETLKCGDSLYISRALKCPWLYDDEFKHIINPDNLHGNIFPFMSTKMKKKTMAAIALHTKETGKAYCFYKYCISTQMETMALDFLVKTSDDVKLEILNVNFGFGDSIKFQHFFGNSIELIEFYLEKRKDAQLNIDRDLTKFRYFYSISDEKYLSLLEKYTFPHTCTHYAQLELFGLRISKDIMVNHKSRVLEKPWLYIRKLNYKMIIKHSTSDDAKIYLKALLPDNANTFWSMNYYQKYVELFQLLPACEIYPFLKEIFLTKYPNTLFEMDVYFYRLKYYELLTTEERNRWALKHLEAKKELLGPGEDYRWYQFVQFNVAFREIKKCIYVTTDKQVRAAMLGVLIYAASTQEDLEQLLTHYYERHVNEDRDQKQKFIDTIIDVHNVFEFNDKCWNPVYKLLLSMDILSSNKCIDKYPMLVIVYHILNVNKIPENLMPHYLSSGSYLFRPYLQKLNQDQQQLVYQCFINYYEDKIKESMAANINDQDKKKWIVEHIFNVLRLMEGYKKTKDDCTQKVMDCIVLYWEEFKHHTWFASPIDLLSEGVLLRTLKKDKLLLVNKLPALKNKHYILSIKNLLRKIKIYFSNDIAKSCLTFFEEWLLEKNKNSKTGLNQIIFSLFQLGDADYKNNFLLKHAPTEKKIQHDIIDKDLLKIQEAICRFAFYSRPPVPLSTMLQYIVGDYVHFCLPMFNSYLVNLPMPQSIKFIEAILDAPVSIQKHGLRMAFVSYNTDNLKGLICNVWNKTANVSLRAIIYVALFEKMLTQNEIAQTQLFEVLKMFTADVNEQDQDEIFNLLVSSSLPARFKGDYLQTAWTAVAKLSDQSSINIQRKTSVLQCIETNMELIDRDFCRKQIIDDHMRIQFTEKQILHFDNLYGIYNLFIKKWNITAKYITYFGDEELNSSIEILQLVMTKGLEMWNEVQHDKYKIREFLINFILKLRHETDYRKDRQQKPYINPIFEYVIDSLQRSWSTEEMYTVIWNLKLNIWGRISIGNGKYNDDKKAVTYDHLSVTEVSNNFVSYVIHYVENLLSEQRYVHLFYSEIGNLINKNIGDVICWTNIDYNLLTCHVSHALAKTTLHEARVLSIVILPVDVPCYCNTVHSAVINTIKELDNYELNALMYSKFIYTDFKKRI